MTNETKAPQSHGRALLWSVLVVSAVANAATSAAGLSVFISVTFGLLTLACGIALFAGRRKNN
ncbi:hypothetical protein [Amycolatopsis thailandensis]|uniref:hypothetical protein n=1 Tax=Amycolatopsis thailandensis TaxID=589330 RepID=UPI003632CB0C